MPRAATTGVLSRRAGARSLTQRSSPAVHDRALIAALVAALEIRRLLAIAVTFVLRMPWVRTQRPAAAREGHARRFHRIRRGTLLHPVLDRGQQVEAIERRRAAAAVTHAGHEEQPARLRHDIGTTVIRSHLRVVANGVFGREPRI